MKGGNNVHYDEFVQYDSSPRRNQASKEGSKGLPEALITFDCGCCGRPVSSGELRIKCAECKDFGVCANCFRKGKETKEHKNTHAYRVLVNLASEKMQSDCSWGLDEELLLFEGIELYGVGNWTGVATHVTTKSKEECEKHYMDVYVHDFWGVPVPEKTKEVLRKERVVEKKLRKAQVEKKDMAGADVAGFMPLRQEFDVEYHNEAERLISNLSFEKAEYCEGAAGAKTKAEVEESRRSKLELVKKYNEIVDERIRRKAFVIEYDLLRWRNWKRRSKKGHKQDVELRRLLMPLARYIKRQDFEELVQGILKETALREEVAFLKECQDRGLTTMHEVEQFRRSRGRTTPTSLGRARRKDPEQVTVSRSGRKSKRRRTYTGTYAEDPADGLEQLDEPDEDDLDAKPAVRTNGFDYSTLPRYIEPKKADPSKGTMIKPKDLIAASEKSLCTMLKIDAWQYIKVKSILIEECVRQKIFIRKKDGGLRPAEKGNQAVLLDISKSGKNLDLHVRVMTPAAIAYRKS